MVIKTKEEKKSLILKYLDELAKDKEFIVNKFTISSISKKIGIEEDEAINLVEELKDDEDIERFEFMYPVFFPKGEYKTLKKELKKIDIIPEEIDTYVQLGIGAFIAWFLIVISGTYNYLIQKFINDSVAFLIVLLALVIISYLFGYSINEVYKRVLMKNEDIRKKVTKIKPVFLTGLIIWIIMLIPFGILYYFLDEQTKIYSILYLVITFPTTVLTAIEYQRYSAK